MDSVPCNRCLVSVFKVLIKHFLNIYVFTQKFFSCLFRYFPINIHLFSQSDDCGRLSRCSYRIIRKEGSFNYHIVYVVSGKWEAVYNNETYSLSEGNFIFYYPNQPQNYAFYPENDGCEVLWLHFPGSAVREILNDLNFLPGVYRCRKSESIISSFSKLIHEDRLKSMYHNTAKNSLAIYLLLAMARNIALNRNVPWDTRTADLDINRVVTEMYQQYNNEYNPEHYAEICAMSVSGFSHKFKRILGVGQKKYYISSIFIR